VCDAVSAMADSCGVAHEKSSIPATLGAMDSNAREPTQQTQPKQGEPIEIPVPKKRDVLDFLEKVAHTPDPEKGSKTP
jgi:hypothetical protein